MKKITALLLTFLLLISVSLPVFAEGAEAFEKPFSNSSFFTKGDYTLHYREYFPNGEPVNRVLLIHGFGLSTASLEGIAEEYKKAGYYVVLADMPDFGYSTRETEKTALIDRETLTYELMKSLSDGKWIVGGHSMGGGIAMNIATDHPESVSGLVLFAPQNSFETEGVAKKLMTSFPVRTAFNLLIRYGTKSKLIMRLLVEMSFSDGSFAKEYELSRIQKPLGIKNTGAGMAIMAANARGTDFNKLSELSVPTVIITCKNDKVADADRLKTITDNAPKGTVIYEFDKGGHMMMEYDPVRTAELTVPVMDKCGK